MSLSICDTHSPILYISLYHTNLHYLSLSLSLSLSLYLIHPQSYSLCLSLYVTPTALFSIAPSITQIYTVSLSISYTHSPILYASLYMWHPQLYSLYLSLTPSSLCLSHTNLQCLSNSDTHSPVHYRSFSLKLTLFLSLSLSDTHLHSPILEVSLAATYLKLSLPRSYTYSVSFFYSLCELLPCKPILSCALPLTHTVSNTYSQLSLHLSYVYAVSSSLSQVYYYLCFLVHSHNR